MSIWSQSPQALLQAGLQSLQQGRPREAAGAFQAALRLEPDSAVAHHLLGLSALQSGQLEAGVESLKRSIALDPRDPGAYGNLGNGLRDLGRIEEALQAYAAALAITPSLPDVLSNRGILFARLARFDEALADYDRALAINERIASLHNDRAVVLQAMGRPAEALESCAAALRLNPAYADAHLNRGAALSAFGRDQEAIAAYEACLAANPGRAEAVYSMGTAYLALGDLERGFERYEARLAFTGRRRVAPEARFAQPVWRGEGPLQGKTILLHSEQGLGDTLQFCRYADRAKDQGATVILQVEASLVSLLSTLRGADQVVAKGADLPAFDLHASIMSLPAAFRTSLPAIPAEVPYLHADPGKAAAWERRLGPKTRPRVGLVWQTGARPDRPDLVRRNVPLRMLAALGQAEADFVSLQKGAAAEAELAELVAGGWNGPAMLDPAADLHDFSDTAALMAGLDLVITVDTAVAHLAGAMGKPVWILNRFDSCWRWMRGRTDSPWYPTARLFRQEVPGDWSAVVEAVVEALKARLGAQAPDPAGAAIV